MKYHSSVSPVASTASETRRPGHSTAFAFSTCLRRGTEMFGESKKPGSGQKRTVVPVWPRLAVPTASSFENTLPFLKPMFHSLPSRRTLHSRCFESALTTETPTPCRPPALS